jgi:hypothetical protein
MSIVRCSDEASDKWQSLQGQFSREHKLQRETKSGNSPKQLTFRQYCSMQFLGKHVKQNGEE